MSQNNCTPSRVFGGDWNQHLFLGCSIKSVNASIGWNEQQSEVDVVVVQDSCKALANRPKVYYDQNLNRKTTTAADPGFTSPNVGSPVYLRLDDFEYTGIIQSYERVDNESSFPTYNVKLVGPNIILQGAQVIIGDYAGDIYSTPNVFNAYGFAESFGILCPFRQVLGAYFGSPAGAFGGAAVNDNGMRWNTIKDAISILTSAIPIQSGMFGGGRLIYVGSQNPGYGSLKADFIDPTVPFNFPQQTPYQSFYYLDLSEVPNAPAYYRVTGTSISILDLISTVAEDGGFDYYLELVPIRMGGGIIKVIKVRVAVRSSQPVLGRIQQFVNAAGNVVSKTIGQELRNETTSNFIIGGQIEEIYQADEAALTAANLLDEEQDIIIPYWGLDKFNNIIPTFYDDNDKLYFTVDITDLNTLLYQPLDIDEATITEYELQAALTGQDAWIAIASSLPSDLGNQLQLAGVLDARRILNVLNNVGFPHHLIVPGKAAGGGVVNFDDLRSESKKLKDVETVYNFVLNYAREFYGKKYIVRVPYTCCRIDDENFQTQSTESPTDSGWTEYGNVIGLSNPGFTEFFKDDEGKIEPFARFDSAKDTIEISNVPEDDFLLIEGETADGDDASELFIRASNVLEDFVYEDFATRFNPFAVVELASPILQRLDELDLHRTKEFANKFFDTIKSARTALGLPGATPIPDMNDILKNTGNSLLHLGITSEFKKPDAIAVAIKSNVLRYGPWISEGPVGPTNIQTNDGLVPWEYGSVASMNLAGQQMVAQGVSYMQVGEMGSVTIPGFPELSLGAELLFDGLSVLDNRTITSNNQPDISNTRKAEKGKWDATSGSAPTTTPKNGDYYIITKTGTTNLNGTANWTKGNLAVFKNDRWEQQLDPKVIFLTFNSVAWFGTFGPNITNISIEVGDGGVQTTYTMRTYTPKFGRFSKRNADRLQEYSQIINLVRKQARLQALAQLKVQTNRQHNTERLFSNRLGNPFSAFAASPPGVLIGQVVGIAGGKKSTAVHVIKHNELLSEIDKYEHKAMMSLDGLLRPISKDGSGGLPRFAKDASGVRTYFSTHPGEPDLPLPPIQNYTPLQVSQPQADPWATGHDIDILARGTTVPNNLSIPLDNYNYTSDYRGFALHGPILLHQFGFDLNGKPVPNAADTEADASGGVFKSYGLEDSFLDGFGTKPHTWPVAPIDLRLDRKRGVWVCPPPYKNIITAQLIEDLTWRDIDGNAVNPSEFEGSASRYARAHTFTPREGSDGTLVSPGLIYVYDSFIKAYTGDQVLVYHDFGTSYGIIRKMGPDQNQGQLIYKAVEPSKSNPKYPYDTVKASLCNNLNGDLFYDSNQQTSDATIKLMKHHIGTANVGDNYNSACHMHDVRIGDVLICSQITETTVDSSGNTTGVEQSIAAISDYSREHEIFYAIAIADSTAPDFPDFKIQFKTPDNEVDGPTVNQPVTVKNRLKQPILNGDCCYVYRHKSLLGSIDHEFWLLRGVFSPICVVSDIQIGTEGQNTEGFEDDNFDSAPPYAYSSIAYSKTLEFAIRDITLYSDTPFKYNNWSDGSTYLGMVLDTDVFSYCCSVPNTLIAGEVGSNYQIDINAFYVQNLCDNEGSQWTRNGQSQSDCDPTVVTFLE